MAPRFRTAMCAAVVGLSLVLAGPAHAQVAESQSTETGQKITAYEDYTFTPLAEKGNYTSYTLHAGETFESSGDTFKITDANGQVIQEGFVDGRPTPEQAAANEKAAEQAAAEQAAANEKAAEQAAAEQAAEAAKEREAKDRTVMLGAGIGVAVLAVLGVVVAVTLRRRRGSAGHDESEPEAPADPPDEVGGRF